MCSEPLPLLIIGAGISGLTLAQHLHKTGVPFRIFERDASIAARNGGWGLTFHWALPTLQELLPVDIFSQLEEAYVNRDAAKKGDMGRYHFFNLATGNALYDVPAAARIRVSRTKLRKVLTKGINVQWSKRLENISSLDDAVVARFEDGTSCKGFLLVACDGSHSQVRKLLYPFEYHNKPVPVQLVGATVRYSAAQAAQARSMDPFFLQGTHPTSNVYLYFSFLETPIDRETRNDDHFCQIVISWPESKNIQVPSDNAERIALMKKLTKDWAEPFYSLLQNIPEDSESLSITIEDWLPSTKMHGNSRIVLMGDAAHTMTMFRGEGANNAVLDVHDFVKWLGPYLPGHIQGRSDSEDTNSVKGADSAFEQVSSLRRSIENYERDIYIRAAPCVSSSRQACLDAHNYSTISDRSPLVSKRLEQAAQIQTQAEAQRA